MALDLQPPNLSGLAAIAGKSSTVNMFPTGALGLQALQQRQSNEAMLRKDALEKAQMQQQGQLALAQQSIQRQQIEQQAANAERQGLFQDKELAFRQQQFGQQGGMAQAELALKQQQMGMQGDQFRSEMDLKKQMLFQDHQKQEMAKLMAEKKEKLQEKGAYASYALMTMNGAKTPEEATQYWNLISKEALDKKYMTKEQADQMSQMPLSQRKNALKGMVMNLGMAKEYKDMQDKVPASGVIEMTGSDGTTFKYSPATTAEKGKLQEGIAGADNNIREIKSMLENVPESFFGATAIGQFSTWAREWAENVPLVGKIVGPRPEAKKDLELYSNLQSQTKNLSMNIIRDLSGLSYTDKQLEFMVDIVPSIGPKAVRSEFDGKSQNLLRFFEASKSAKQELLDKGFKLDSPQYKDAMLEKMKGIASEIKSSPQDDPLFARYRQHPDYADWSDAEIRASMKQQKKGGK